MRSPRTRTGTGTWLATVVITAALACPALAGPASATGGAADTSTQTQDGASDAPDIVVDPGYDGPVGTAARGQQAAGAAAYPLEQSFLLHSQRGSSRTIFLDFDGGTVSDTRWNAATDGHGALPAGAQPGWSQDASPAFSATELSAVQDIWQQVAEDYAPFDVDVTTQDPGAAALDRSGSADTVFGSRALITGSRSARTNADATLCGGACGGLAYIDVFDSYASSGSSTHAAYQPAWVFPENLADDPKAMADAVSHEIGHNLGLSHDGMGSADYYAGSGAWGPIMGSPYDVPITQWSRGQYAGANQTEDDLAVIAAGGAPRRIDTVGATVGAAPPLPAPTGTPASTGVIDTAGDVDVYALGTCSGTVTVAATPSAAIGPNLDIALSLLDRYGNTLRTDNPASARASRTLATGLGAQVTYEAGAGGPLYASVDGVGGTGYTDYDSLGRYTLAVAGCASAAGAPSAPRSPTAVVAGTSVTVGWSAPAISGSGPVDGYTVTASPGGAVRTTPGSDTSTVFGGLTPGTDYTFAVTAHNTSGLTSTPASVAATTASTVPGAVVALEASTSPDGQVTITWSAPVADGGSSVTGYRLQVGALSQSFGPSVGTVTVSGLAPGAAYTAIVSATNAVGDGPATSRGFTLTGAPAVLATPGSGGAVTTLSRPKPAGSATVGDRVKVRGGRWSAPVTLRYAWRASGKRIPGATRASYAPPPRLLGRTLSVVVTATAPGRAPVRTTLSWGRVRR